MLILGSLPGQASLAARQYYAQPRNAFWTIMGELCGAGPNMPYEARLTTLKQSGIALWDVLLEASRPGSLDSSIVRGSESVNDIEGLLAAHETLALIAFNGQKAAAIFRSRVEVDVERGIETLTLPSTSPAYAALPRSEKLRRWREALRHHLPAESA